MDTKFTVQNDSCDIFSMQSLDHRGDEQTICLGLQNYQRRQIRPDLPRLPLVVNDRKRAAGTESFCGKFASQTSTISDVLFEFSGISSKPVICSPPVLVHNLIDQSIILGVWSTSAWYDIQVCIHRLWYLFLVHSWYVNLQLYIRMKTIYWCI